MSFLLNFFFFFSVSFNCSGWSSFYIILVQTIPTIYVTTREAFITRQINALVFAQLEASLCRNRGGFLRNLAQCFCTFVSKWIGMFFGFLLARYFFIFHYIFCLFLSFIFSSDDQILFPKFSDEHFPFRFAQYRFWRSAFVIDMIYWERGYKKINSDV